MLDPIPSVLPPHSSFIEKALERSGLWVVENSRIVDVWNPETCPPEFLAWLAWSLSVDDWEPEWSDETKRNAVRASVNIHRRKGTPGAIRDAVRAFGFGEITLVEGYTGFFHDGTPVRDGVPATGNRESTDHWAEYRVYLQRPISIAQSNQLRQILKNVAPARCHLKELNYTEVSNLHNNTVPRDGTFSRGVA